MFSIFIFVFSEYNRPFYIINLMVCNGHNGNKNSSAKKCML